MDKNGNWIGNALSLLFNNHTQSLKEEYFVELHKNMLSKAYKLHKTVSQDCMKNIITIGNNDYHLKTYNTLRKKYHFNICALPKRDLIEINIAYLFGQTNI